MKLLMLCYERNCLPRFQLSSRTWVQDLLENKER